MLVFGSDLATVEDLQDLLGPLRHDFLRREPEAELYRGPSILIGQF